jgi:hypothetical protein
MQLSVREGLGPQGIVVPGETIVMQILRKEKAAPSHERMPLSHSSYVVEDVAPRF